MNTRFKYNIYLVAWEIKTYIVYRLYRFSPPYHKRTRDVCLFLRVRSKRTCVCVNSCLILHKPTDDIVYRCISEYACNFVIYWCHPNETLHDFISVGRLVGWTILCHSNVMNTAYIHNTHINSMQQKGFHLYGIIHIL